MTFQCTSQGSTPDWVRTGYCEPFLYKTRDLYTTNITLLSKHRFNSNPPGYQIGQRSRIGDCIFLFDSPELAGKLKWYDEDHRISISKGFNVTLKGGARDEGHQAFSSDMTSKLMLLTRRCGPRWALTRRCRALWASNSLVKAANDYQAEKEEVDITNLPKNVLNSRKPFNQYANKQKKYYLFSVHREPNINKYQLKM